MIAKVEYVLLFCQQLFLTLVRDNKCNYRII